MLRNYQRIVRRGLEYCYKFHALLKGYEFEDINIVFNPIKSLQPDRDAQVLKTMVESVVMLLEANLIDRATAERLIKEVLKK